MSALQNEAKPLVYALANGTKVIFDDSQRFILARWSAMVTINLECYGRVHTTKHFQRTALMNGEMPSGWRVSIANMVDTDCAGRSLYRALTAPLRSGNHGDYVEVGSTYYVIERAAFHTLNTLNDVTLRMVLLGMGLSEVQFHTTDIWPDYAADAYQFSRDLTGQDLDNIQRHFGYEE